MYSLLFYYADMPRTKQFDEEEILQKATVLFWRKGFYNTSIQDLVNFLGINRASIYDTFGGKRELFDKALTHYRKVNTEIVKKLLYTYQDPKQGFKALFDFAIQEASEEQEHKGCFAVNTTTEMLPGDNAAAGMIRENKRVFESIFNDYLKAGQENGFISPEKNTEGYAGMLFMLYNGLRVIGKAETDKHKLNTAVHSALSCI